MGSCGAGNAAEKRYRASQLHPPWTVAKDGHIAASFSGFYGQATVLPRKIDSLHNEPTRGRVFERMERCIIDTEAFEDPPRVHAELLTINASEYRASRLTRRQALNSSTFVRASSQRSTIPRSSLV
jgi:hypothetical protein